jgi:AI-2 transport protein TqsA
MTEPTRPSRGTNALFVIAALVVVAAGLRAAAPIVVLLLLSLFLAILALAPISWLRRWKVPPWLAIVLVTSLMLGVLLLLAVVVGNSITEFSSSKVEYQARLHQMTAEVVAWATTRGIDLRGYDIHRVIDPGVALDLVDSLLAELGSMMGNALLIIFTVVFILFEAVTFPQKLRAMTSNPDRPLGYLARVRSEVNGYFGVLTAVSLLTAALVTLFLLAIGVDFALVWGLLAFLLNFVPNIGSILAAVPPILLALVELGPGAALLTAAGYLIVNLVIGNIIEPRLLGRGLGLSTLTVFVSLILWGWLLGPVGMLVSVPLTGAIKLALEASDSTRPIAILLGTGDAAQSDR